MLKFPITYIASMLVSLCAFVFSSQANGNMQFDSDEIAFLKLVVTASDKDILEYYDLSLKAEEDALYNRKIDQKTTEQTIMKLVEKIQGDNMHIIAKCDKSQTEKDMLGLSKKHQVYEAQKYILSLPSARAACLGRLSLKAAIASNFTPGSMPPLSSASDGALVEFNKAVYNRTATMKSPSSSEYEKLVSEVAVWDAMQKIQDEKNPAIGKCDKNQANSDLLTANSKGSKEATTEYILSLPLDRAACALRMSVKAIEQSAK